MTDQASAEERSAIVADPRHALPKLQQLMASYFHQDWSAKGESWTGVIDDCLAESTPSTITAAAADLRRVTTAGFDEPTLRWLLDNLDCNLDPTGIGLDARTWLASLLERLQG